MPSQSVLVTDTNIWFDLENGGILADVFGLPYQFLIPDVAIGELIHPRWETLHVLGLEANELPGEQVIELAQLRLLHKSLSNTDLAAFLLARLLKAILLTGDWRLTKLASTNGLTAHGILWVLDEMVRFQIITPVQAASSLKRILSQGARLPEDECNKRLSFWSE